MNEQLKILDMTLRLVILDEKDHQELGKILLDKIITMCAIKRLRVQIAGADVEEADRLLKAMLDEVFEAIIDKSEKLAKGYYKLKEEVENAK